MINSLFPHRCPLCLRSCEGGFCQDCNQLLPWIKTACPQCGTPCAIQQLCGQCIKQPPHYTSSIIPCLYTSPVDKLVQDLKYNQQLYIANLIADVLYQRILKSSNALPDVLVPIPLHTKRLKHRGFNQSVEIAKSLSKWVGVPVHHASLIRIIDTPSQTHLEEAKRHQNIKNAFQMTCKLSGLRAALIDDVVTSGSTANEAAKTLLGGDVKEVYLWAMAKT